MSKNADQASQKAPFAIDILNRFHRYGIFKALELTEKSFWVLFDICSRLGQTPQGDNCYPSRKELAAFCSLSESTINRARSELIEKNLITATKRGKGKTSSCHNYRLSDSVLMFDHLLVQNSHIISCKNTDNKVRQEYTASMISCVNVTPKLCQRDTQAVSIVTNHSIYLKTERKQKEKLGFATQLNSDGAVQNATAQKKSNGHSRPPNGQNGVTHPNSSRPYRNEGEQERDEHRVRVEREKAAGMRNGEIRLFRDALNGSGGSLGAAGEQNSCNKDTWLVTKNTGTDHSPADDFELFYEAQRRIHGKTIFKNPVKINTLESGSLMHEKYQEIYAEMNIIREEGGCQ